MRRSLIWHYRTLLTAWGYLKWQFFKERPQYQVNDIVAVKLSTAIYGEVKLRARITGVTYRMFVLTYDIIMQGGPLWCPYGTRTWVQAANILGHDRRKTVL